MSISPELLIDGGPPQTSFEVGARPIERGGGSMNDDEIKYWVYAKLVGIVNREAYQELGHPLKPSGEPELSIDAPGVQQALDDLRRENPDLYERLSEGLPENLKVVEHLRSR